MVKKASHVLHKGPKEMIIIRPHTANWTCAWL